MLYIKCHLNNDNDNDNDNDNELEINRADGLLGVLQVELNRNGQVITNSHTVIAWLEFERDHWLVPNKTQKEAEMIKTDNNYNFKPCNILVMVDPTNSCIMSAFRC